MTLRSTQNTENLLEQGGIFFLKDIVHKLNLNSAHVIKLAKALNTKENPLNSYKIMGVRKVWNHWVVRMTVFAPYYLDYLKNDIQKVNPKWDANTLLFQTGSYYLADVCKKIPFNNHQLRHQAKRLENSKDEIGIWKDTRTKRFVVDMLTFKNWIQSTWEGNYQGAKDRKGANP